MVNYNHINLEKIHILKLITMDKNNFDEKEKLTPNKKDHDRDQKELASQMNRTLSRHRGIIRIVLSILAFLLWFFIGVSPTLLFSSYIQQFIGFYSFFFRNPVLFLIIALINIFLGLISYFLIGILWWSAFHILWSIRWFYGFIKYRKLKSFPQTK